MWIDKRSINDFLEEPKNQKRDVSFRLITSPK